MTKEELKQEAIKYINSKQKPLTKYDLIAFAEPREKQITGLSKHILELQKDKGNLIDRCRELEQQIEKMKRCYNCDFMFSNGNCYYDEECKNKDHWKLRR